MKGRASWLSVLWLLTTLSALCWPAPARAHEMSMAEMEVRETSKGEFIWQWSAQNDKRPMGADLTPKWPEVCTAGPNVLHCGQDGLKGTLSVEGVGDRYSAAIVGALLGGSVRA